MQQIEGERYEYEINVLLEYAKRNRRICEVPITTIYLDDNKSSHFHAVALQQCGIYTLTVGSIFRGILDIYGTTNHAGVIYWWGGIGLFAVGILMECILHGKN